jgi:hypothetical protein
MDDKQKEILRNSIGFLEKVNEANSKTLQPLLAEKDALDQKDDLSSDQEDRLEYLEHVCEYLYEADSKIDEAITCLEDACDAKP